MDVTIQIIEKIGELESLAKCVKSKVKSEVDGAAGGDIYCELSDAHSHIVAALQIAAMALK